ncbi:hypothetical protein BHQ23_04580 [Mycobacterium gordonae]|uniref:Uncharacterized protein n=1 Tax=Mycobacterium gordonae TaxID=1778 RepID=A0A1X1X8J3_MYCGO|nr:hypothetical protein BHQ23_04580 [Mycobacterium gordonae]ORV95225.1 hypothetical protein AWC08_15350 [Mycobacterium gordonae]
MRGQLPAADKIADAVGPDAKDCRSFSGVEQVIAGSVRRILLTANFSGVYAACRGVITGAGNRFPKLSDELIELSSRGAIDQQRCKRGKHILHIRHAEDHPVNPLNHSRS